MKKIYKQTMLELRIQQAEREIDRLRGALFAVFDVCRELQSKAPPTTHQAIHDAHEKTQTEFLYSAASDVVMDGHDGARMALTPMLQMGLEGPTYAEQAQAK